MNYQLAHHHHHSRHKSIFLFVILIATCLSAFFALLNFGPTLDNRSQPIPIRVDHYHAFSTPQQALIKHSSPLSPSKLIPKQSKQLSGENNKKGKTTKIVTTTSKTTTKTKTKIATTKRKAIPNRALLPDNSNKYFLIDKPKGCGEDNGYGIDLALIVFSRVSSRESRDAVRETWGKLAVSRGSILYFLIGADNAQNGTQNGTAKALQEEDRRFEDLLQADLPDSDDTLKSIAMLRFLAANCARVRWALRTTDQTFINARSVVDYSESSIRIHRSIVGNLARKWKVPRDAKNAYHLPRDVYAANTYPDFVLSPSYLITGDAIKPLREAMEKIGPKNFVPLDDLFVTGVVAERAQVKRLGERRAWNLKTIVDECNFETMWFSESYTPQDIRTRWEIVYTVKCLISTTTRSARKKVKAKSA